MNRRWLQRAVRVQPVAEGDSAVGGHRSQRVELGVVLGVELRGDRVGRRRQDLQRKRREMAGSGPVGRLVAEIVLRGALVRVVALAERHRHHLARSCAGAARLPEKVVGQAVADARDAADDGVDAVQLDVVIEVVDRRDTLDVEVRLDRVLQLLGVSAAGVVEDAAERRTVDLHGQIPVVTTDRLRQVEPGFQITLLGPERLAVRHARRQRQELPFGEREAQPGKDVEAREPLIDRRGLRAPLGQQVRALALDREVERRAEQRLLRALKGDAGRAARQRRLRGPVEELAVVERAVDVPAADRAGDRPADDALAVGRLEDVLVVRLLDGDVGEVVDAAARAELLRQLLRHVARDLVALAGRRGRRAAVRVRVLRFVLLQVVEPNLSIGSRRGDIAVLAADPGSGLREPVVEERRVLAPVDRPVEGVAQRRPADRGAPVQGHQEPRRAVLLVDRVVHDRQVQHRHALHLEECVGEHRVVIEVEDDRA